MKIIKINVLIIAIFFICIGLCYGEEEIILSFNDNKTKYSFYGYAIKDNNFFIGLYDNNKDMIISYKYWQNKLIKIDISNFDKFDITRKIYDYWKVLKKDLFPNNEIIQKYISRGIKIDESKYILLFDKSYNEPELNIFDGKTFKKIKMDGICAVIMGESFLYYENEYKNLYFSGYKKVKKNTPAYDKGLYVYNFKTGNTRLLEKAKDDYMLIAPYRIPGTDKLIFISNHRRYLTRKVYIRDIEK